MKTIKPLKFSKALRDALARIQPVEAESEIESALQTLDSIEWLDEHGASVFDPKNAADALARTFARVEKSQRMAAVARSQNPPV